jgi:D-alanine-D-alanine ligase
VRILILCHPSHVGPENVTEKDFNFEAVEWEAEYNVRKNLTALGYIVKTLGVYDELHQIRHVVDEFKPHIVFNLLEEFCGEAIFDQNVVSFLELLDVPYTGCNPKGLILGRDKALSKKILTYHKIHTPKFIVVPRNQGHRKISVKKYPVIVKCLTEEASLGLSQASIVHNAEKLKERVQFIHENFKSDALVEEFIEGKEFFIGVMGNFHLKVLPVWELTFENASHPEKEFYSERAKFNEDYRKRKGISTGKANIDIELEKRMQRIAKRTFKVFGLSGYARIDLRVDAEGKIYVIEANPNPDISIRDDFALSAKHIGYRYKELLKKIVQYGLQWSPRHHAE